MKKKLLWTFLVLIILFLFLSFYSCKGDIGSNLIVPPPPPPPPTKEVVVKKNLKVLNSTSKSKVYSVTPNSISFSGGNSEIDSLKVGDYLFSTPTEKAPIGFMRKIIGIKKVGNTNSWITFSTTYAPLSEVVESGSLKFNRRIFSYTKSKTFVIFDLDGNTSTKEDQTYATANFSFSGDLSGNFSFDVNPSFDLNLILSGNLSSELVSKIQKNFNKKFPIHKLTFPAIVAFATPPIVVVPHIEVYLKIEGKVSGNFKTGFSDKVNLTFKSSYHDQLTFSKDFRNNFSKKETVLYFDGKVKIKLGIEGSFIINEVVGPSLGFEPYGEADVSTTRNPAWILYAGVDGTYGIRTGWFSFGLIPEKNWTYYIARKEIARSILLENKPPTAIINISPSSGITTSTEVRFSNLSSIDDKTPPSKLVGRWDFDGNGTWDTDYKSLGYSYHTYSQPGTYSSRLEVKDEGGLTGTATKNILVNPPQNSAPIFYDSFIPKNGAINVNPDITFSWDAYDPEGDPLKYTLSIGSNGSPLTSLPPQSQNSFHLGNYFPSGTKVSWKVVAKDDHNNSTESDLMSFTVGSLEEKVLTLQPGPEGKDANVFYYRYPDGQEYFKGEPNEELLEVVYDDFSGAVKKEALFEFEDVSKIPPSSLIKSAKFKVYGWGTVNYSNEIPTISLVKLENSWEESNVKWDTKPEESLILKKELIYKGSIQWYEFDVTSLVQSWVNGEKNYGIGLTTEQNSFYGKIYSGDNKDSSKRPILEIIYQ